MATETTTKCDRCGEVCVNGAVVMFARTEHWTSGHEVVGEDTYTPVELCFTCGGVAIEMLGLQRERDTEVPRIIELGDGLQLHRRGPVYELPSRHEMTVMAENNQRSHP